MYYRVEPRPTGGRCSLRKQEFYWSCEGCCRVPRILLVEEQATTAYRSMLVVGGNRWGLDPLDSQILLKGSFFKVEGQRLQDGQGVFWNRGRNVGM